MRHKDLRQAQALERAVVGSVHEPGGLGQESLQSEDGLGLGFPLEHTAVPLPRK